MSNNQADSIERSQAMYRAVTNRSTRITQSLDELQQALKAGKTDVLVELPWGEMRPDGMVERHQVILTHMEKGRVYFINALKSPLPVGTDISGMRKGPARRVEERGLESMELGAFGALFAKGGKAMLEV